MTYTTEQRNEAIAAKDDELSLLYAEREALNYDIRKLENDIFWLRNPECAPVDFCIEFNKKNENCERP